MGQAWKPILKGKEKTMIKTIFEEHADIAEARGEARGKAETVLTVLRARFKKVPKEVEKSIRAMTDSIALESWAATAATCATMDEFADMLE